MKAWSIEGNTQRLDGGAMFGNVPRALWSRWVEVDERHRIALACRALLVELDDGRRVLFETGIGAFFEPSLRERYGVEQAEHRLLESLHALGLEDGDIDVIVLSHLHFDHAGGLLAAWQPDTPPRLLFPKARFVVGREQLERARAPHPRDRASYIPGLVELLEASGRLEVVDGSAESALSARNPQPAHCAALGSAVGFYFSDGHTPGLMLSVIGGDGGIAYCADLIPGRPWVHLPVTMGYDRHPELLIDEKRRFLEDRLARGQHLFYTHDAQCAASAVARDGEGRYRASSEHSALVAVSLPLN